MLENFPGEKLLIKLVDTLDKGLGNITKPWQIKRESTARTQALRQKLLILEQTKNDIKDIQEGRKAVDDGGNLILLPHKEDDNVALANETSSLLQEAQKYKNIEKITHYINLQKIGIYAQEEAEHMSNSVVSDDPIDPDWFTHWRNSAQNVSHEEMQRLWGRVLASEVKQPGTYSLRTLEFIARMSKEDAKILEKIASLSLENHLICLGQEVYDELNISFGDLLYLCEIGILNGVVGIGGLEMTRTLSPQGEKKYLPIINGNIGIALYTEAKIQEIKYPAYTISLVGREVCKLATFEPNIKYLEKIVKFFKGKGFAEAKLGIKDGNTIINLKDFPNIDAL